MATLQSLIEKRSATFDAIAALKKEAEAQEDGWTEDQLKSFSDLNDDLEKIAPQIKTLENVEKRLHEQAEKAAPKSPAFIRETGADSTLADSLKRFNLEKAILEVAERGLTGREKEVHEMGEKMNRGAKGNLQIPNVEKRDLLADTAGDGAEMIGVDVHPVIPFLYGKRVLPSCGAQVWRNLDFDYKVPIVTGSGSVAWEGEGDPAAETTMDFTPKTLTPNRVGATIDVSKQLLIQARGANPNGIVANNLRTLIDNAVESEALLGGASAATDSVVGTITTLATAASTPDYGDATELEEAIASANAEMGDLCFITNPFMRSVLRTVDVGTDTGYFVWGGRYLENEMAMPGEGTILGYRAVTTTLVGGGSTSDSNYIMYGNWKDLVIGQFGGYDLLVNPYTKSKNALIEITANVWVDCIFLHDESFAYATYDYSGT